MDPQDAPDTKNCGPLLRGPGPQPFAHLRLGISFTAGVEEQLGHVSGEPPQWAIPAKGKFGKSSTQTWQLGWDMLVV